MAEKGGAKSDIGMTMGVEKPKMTRSDQEDKSGRDKRQERSPPRVIKRVAPLAKFGNRGRKNRPDRRREDSEKERRREGGHDSISQLKKLVSGRSTFIRGEVKYKERQKRREGKKSLSAHG